MTTYSQPIGQPTGPLQPTAGPTVPQGLNIGAPGHTPIPQHADNYHTSAQDATKPAALGTHPLTAAPIDAKYGQTSTNYGGETVLNVTAPDPKTVHVTGYGSGYTMKDTFENHKHFVTIRRGTGTEGPATTGVEPQIAANAPKTDTSEELYVAQVELHHLRASKISFISGEQVKLKDWLEGRGTHVHTFTEAAASYQWRKGFQGLSRKLELFAMDAPDTCIAWVEKVPTTDETGKPHEPGLPPLPANPGTATLTLTQRALSIVDMVVVSYLLVDRESRQDPLH